MKLKLNSYGRQRYRRRSRLKSPLVAVIATAVVAAAVGGGAVYYTSHQRVSAATPPSSPQIRNAIRRQELGDLGDAINRYVADVKVMPFALPATDTEICSTFGGNCRAEGLLDIQLLLSKGYIDNVPLDPMGGHERFGSGFLIGRDADTGKIRLTAPRTEGGGAPIVVER